MSWWDSKLGAKVTTGWTIQVVKLQGYKAAGRLRGRCHMAGGRLKDTQGGQGSQGRVREGTVRRVMGSADRLVGALMEGRTG